jgi:beta-xylosidase
VPVKRGGFWNACNTVSQRIMGTTAGIAVGKFDLSGAAPGQRAGFVRFGGVYHLMGVRVDDQGVRRLFFDTDGVSTEGPVIQSDDLWIRTTNDGNQADFAYSTDGEHFTRLGRVFTLKFGKWTGDRLGFFCWNDDMELGYIDIDYFHYDYDGPKGARP